MGAETNMHRDACTRGSRRSLCYPILACCREVVSGSPLVVRTECEMMEKRNVQRHRVFAVLVGLALPLALMAIVELGIRGIDAVSGWPSGRLSVPSYLVPSADPELGFEFVPGWSGTMGSTVVSINSLGLRDEEVTPERATQELRIMALGDSMTFGAGVPLEESYPKQMERLLHGRGGIPVRIINAGIGGYNTRQEVIRFQRLAPKLQPHVVMVGFVLNDIEEYLLDIRGQLTQMALPPGPLGWMLWFRYYTYVGRFLTEPMKQLVYMAGVWDFDDENARVNEQWKNSRELVRRSQAELLSLKQRTEPNGIRMVVLLFPNKQQVLCQTCTTFKPQEEMASFCVTNGIPVLDMMAQLRAGDDRAKLFFHPEPEHQDGHYTTAGYTIVAKAVVEFLSTSGVLTR